MMKTQDEITTALRKLDIEFDANARRQTILLRTTRAVAWVDSDEGKEYNLLQQINDEIAAVREGLVWTIDDLGFNPHAQRVEQLIDAEKSILHAGEA